MQYSVSWTSWLTQSTNKLSSSGAGSWAGPMEIVPGTRRSRGQREARMRNYKQIDGATMGIAVPRLLAVYLAFLMLWQTARALRGGGHSLSPDWNSGAGGPSPSRVLLLEEVGVGGARSTFPVPFLGVGVGGPGKRSPSAWPHELELHSQQESTQKAAVVRASWDRCHCVSQGPGCKLLLETVSLARQQHSLRGAASAGEACNGVQPSRRLLSAGESRGFMVSMVTVTVALSWFCAGFLGSLRSNCRWKVLCTGLQVACRWRVSKYRLACSCVGSRAVGEVGTPEDWDCCVHRYAPRPGSAHTWPTSLPELLRQLVWSPQQSSDGLSTYPLWHRGFLGFSLCQCHEFKWHVVLISL